MKLRLLAAACFCIALSTTQPLFADTSTNSHLLSVERIFGQGEFGLQGFGPARWLSDGSGYTTLEPAPAPASGRDFVRYSPESGRKEVLVSSLKLIPKGESTPLSIADYAWSKDTQRLLVFTNTKRVWRRETRGDYWVYDRTSGALKKLGGRMEPSTLMFATFSPDGQKVAFVQHNNLFVETISDDHLTQLTSDGSKTIINGTSDWVNEEEFDLRQGFQWSPDGQHIAYWQFDVSGVRDMTLVDNTSELYPQTSTYAYPKVGETNSACRIGIVKSTGGRTHWLAMTGDPRNHYLPEMTWFPDSRQLMVQRLNRLQNTNEVIVAEARRAKVHTLFTERDEAWVEAVTDWRWQPDGQHFLWLSERDGWRHLYNVAAADGSSVLLTPGEFDVIHYAGMDKTNGWVYFIASPENPTQRYLYRASLQGGTSVERVSPISQPGSHSYDMSSDAQWAFHTYSSFGTPPVTELVRLPGHEVVRVLVDNTKARARLAELGLSQPEFFRVSLSNGPPLDAWCLKPPGFDPARKYPLFLHVYGEPAGSTVVDAWGGNNYLWHQMLAQEGYVVMSIDNRGTAAPRGHDWRKSIYRQIGIMASADQAEATRNILQDRPYLDPSRVGIWGWSGGGSMSLNAIFRYPELYRTALAIAFISDQHYYDTIYQERYMGLPRDNVDGFKNGSPITFAKQLKGNLLIVYGTGDDNCHYQNCEALINELIRQNKQFSLMSYPNRTHGIHEGANTTRHLFETLTRFLEEKLPVQ